MTKYYEIIITTGYTYLQQDVIVALFHWLHRSAIIFTFEKKRRQKLVKHDIPLVRVLTAMDNNTLLRERVACVQTSPPPSGKNRERRRSLREEGTSVHGLGEGGEGKAIILEASCYRNRVCLGHEGFQIHQMSLEWCYLCFKSLFG